MTEADARYIDTLDIVSADVKREETRLRRMLTEWEQHPHRLRAVAILAVAREHGMTQELYEALLRDLTQEQLQERLLRGSTTEQVDAAARLIVARVRQEAAMARLHQRVNAEKVARIQGETADVLAELEKLVAAASTREARA